MHVRRGGESAEIAHELIIELEALAAEVMLGLARGADGSGVCTSRSPALARRRIVQLLVALAWHTEPDVCVPANFALHATLRRCEADTESHGAIGAASARIAANAAGDKAAADAASGDAASGDARGATVAAKLAWAPLEPSVDMRDASFVRAAFTSTSRARQSWRQRSRSAS